ncbi:MAG TPA: hypothetical protein VNI53_10350 [Gammaproteobacteria bacterium]|nr:hypothetical protein [Gammaproteobacteria bacterium]
MSKTLVIAVLLTLSGCALYPPGVDPNGQKLQAAATPVLEAIHTYITDNMRMPKNLNDLIPKYIKQLPDEPKLTYDLLHNVVTFHYIQSLSKNSVVTCSAFIGQTGWVCQ